MPVDLANMITSVKTFSADEKGKAVHEYFEAEQETEGAVVLEDGIATGIVTRREFYHSIGQRYGYSLYYDRPISIIMKKEILKVGLGSSITSVGLLSMNRRTEDLYDFIVVEDESGYHGVLSIRNFLIEMAKLKEREVELLKLQTDKEREYRLDLARRNVCIKSLLDNTGQGFFNFGEDLVIAREYSRECANILGKEPVGIKADGLFANIFGDMPALKDILNMVFSEGRGKKSFVYLSLLPREAVMGQRNVSFEYKLIDLNDKKQVMVIMTDVTDRLTLENRMEEERKSLKLIIRCITSAQDIKLAAEAFGEYLRRVARGNETPEEILRQIHTFKGDFSQLALYNTADKLNRLEDMLCGMIKEGADCAERIREYLGPVDCEKIMREDRRIIAGILGGSWLDLSDHMRLSGQRLEAIKKKLINRFGEGCAEDIENIIASLTYISLRQWIRQYDEYMQTLAQRLEKKIRPIEFAGADIYMDKKAYYRFLKSLVHIFRNIADHGIEYPEVRGENGKDVFGHIRADISLDGESAVLKIEDDGAGIDCGEVKSKAVRQGLISARRAEDMKEEELRELLFVNSFSTKDAAGEVSGRGVGLCAVRAELLAIGGSIRINSAPGKGTAFILRFPLDASNMEACDTSA